MESKINRERASVKICKRDKMGERLGMRKKKLKKLKDV